VREAGKVTGARREEMRIAMSNALVLMRWHDFRSCMISAAVTLPGC
jgi:hypothetical protein